MRTSIVLAMALTGLGAGAAQAAPVAQDLTTWVSAADPELEIQSGTLAVTASTVTMGGNGYRAFVTPGSITGDWVLAGQMRATADNDTMGLVFGYADGANNLRIGWEGGGDWDSETNPVSNGLWVIEETASSATNIFEDSANFWTLNTDYDFTVSSIGGVVDFVIKEGAMTVGSGQVTPGRSTDGQLGVYIGSNNSVFSNITLDTNPVMGQVPLPGSLGLLMGGMAGLAAFGRLRRRN